MPRESSARQFIVGAIATSMGLSREQLAAVVLRWNSNESRRIEDVVADVANLSAQQCDELSALVEQYMRGELRLESTVTLPHLPVSSPTPVVSASQGVGDATSTGKRFERMREHASGGLGIVSIARDKELERDVALKEIRPQYADEESSRRRFVLEAKVTGVLEHPGIVPVYGLGVQNGRPFYAMRFIKGTSLHDAINDYFKGNEERVDRFDSVKSRKLLARFIDVCNAVAYAHSRGIIHRDLKPANIMLGEFGETIVVDWGLAKAGEDETLGQTADGIDPQLTSSGAKVGTPAYMSPEQARGKIEEVDRRSDVYCLGATLYHLLTGRAPIQAANREQALKLATAAGFPRPRQLNRSLHPQLNAICERALSPSPDGRYASVADLASDIECYLADNPVNAYRDGLVEVAARWSRHHQPAVSGIVAILITAVLGLSVGAGLLQNANKRTRLAKNLADRRFSLAIEAIERYYTGVSEDILLRQPQFKELIDLCSANELSAV